MAELDDEGQAGKGIQQAGQVAAVFRIAPEKGRQLYQYGQKLTRLHQRGDTLAVQDRLGRPTVGVHLVGQGAGEFGGKAKALWCLAAHAVHGRSLGHLVPCIVNLGDREDTGVVRQHPGGAGARRVEAGIHPLAVGVSAGSHQNVGRIVFDLHHYHFLMNT